jgi:hypothetical protein
VNGVSNAGITPLILKRIVVILCLVWEMVAANDAVQRQAVCTVNSKPQGQS